MSQRRAYVRVITRCLVAQRQLRERGIEIRRPRDMNLTAYLETVLLPALAQALGTTELLEWEHNPALGLRRKRIDETGRTVYTPAENDHRYIEYKPKSAHLQKTTGRAPGAERTVTSKGSDRYLIAKFDRLEGRTKSRPKRKWASRPFPKGRGFRKREVDKSKR